MIHNLCQGRQQAGNTTTLLRRRRRRQQEQRHGIVPNTTYHSAERIMTEYLETLCTNTLVFSKV